MISALIVMPRSKFVAIGAVVLAFCTTVYSESPKPGKNEVPIRGHRQNIYFYPAEGAGNHRKIPSQTGSTSH